MSSHPEPPADLGKRRLQVAALRGAWFRVHRTAHDPLYFGKAATYRFDAPAGEYGVLYLGRDISCAFIETFGRATGTRIIDQRELAVRVMSRIEARRPLRLVDLRGNGLARLGADAALTAGPDYPLAQRWSQALHAHRHEPDGILYRAKHDPSRISAAVFDRAARALRATSLGTLDSDAPRLAELLDTYDFGLV